jgi:hypothetical protein
MKDDNRDYRVRRMKLQLVTIVILPSIEINCLYFVNKEDIGNLLAEYRKYMEIE